MTTHQTKLFPDTLYIIDGSSLLYRAYYGLTALQTSKGEPVQAVYGFCRALKKIIDDAHPSHMVIAWDAKGPTTRKKVYAPYKEHRQAAPSDLFSQKESIQRFATTINLCQIAQEGWEADDLIASLVKKFTHEQIVIVGPDKDLYQLASTRVALLDPFKKQLFYGKDIEAKYGFPVSKLSFYYALLGDASDNIPGVKGIGEKGATELVQQFHSLDDLYKNLDKVEKPRIKKALAEHEADARLSLELFTLQHPPLDISLHDLQFNEKNWSNAYDFFTEYEFKSMVPAGHKSTDSVTPTPKKPTTWNLICVTNMDQLKKMCADIKKAGICALDCETNGLFPIYEPMVGISFSFNNTDAYYIPLKHVGPGSEEQVNYKEAIEVLREILEDKHIKKLLHNAKFDEQVLSRAGIEMQGLYFDTLIAASLLRTTEDKVGLKALSDRLLHEPMESFKNVLGKHPSFDHVPVSEAASYGAHDSLQTFKLWQIFEPALQSEPTLLKLFNEIEMPFSLVLYDIEKTGIYLDPEVLVAVGKHVDTHIKQTHTKIIHFLEEQGVNAPHEINLNSPRQIEVLLFDDLGLPHMDKSAKGSRSTRHEVLVELSRAHPIPALILTYRELAKLKSTYVEPLPKAIDPSDGRVHTSYSQTSVATGRLASNEPNLQNIPVTENADINIRAAFIAARGKQFISADYSQIELRVLAEMTGDPNLVTAFNKDEDIHAHTAAQIFGVTLNQVTHDQRQVGKRINFSIMYGLTPYGLSRDLNISPSEAKQYIDAYFERYSLVAPWMESVVERAIKDGFVETLWGRRRYIPELREKNKNLFEAGRRAAVNTPVQGTSAELLKLAMIALYEALPQQFPGAHMVLQIHDELVIEAPNEDIEKLSHFMKKTMEEIVTWRIPLKVTIRTGKTWADVTK